MKVATTPAQRTDSENARLPRIDLDFGIVFIRYSLSFEFRFPCFISEPRSVSRVELVKKDVRKVGRISVHQTGHPLLRNFHVVTSPRLHLTCWNPRHATIPVASLYDSHHIARSAA